MMSDDVRMSDDDDDDDDDLTTKASLARTIHTYDMTIHTCGDNDND